MSKDLIDEKVVESSTLQDEYTYKPRERSSKKKSKVPDSNTEKTVKQPTKPNNGNKKNKSNLKKIIVTSSIAILSVAIIATATVLACSFTLPKDKIANNVLINSIDVSSMSEYDVINLLSDKITDDTLISVTAAGKSYEFIASDIDLKLDVQKTYDNAMSIGKSNNIFKNGLDAINLMINKVDVPLAITYSSEKLNALMFEFGSTINGESTKRHYEYTEDSVTIIPGTAGQNQNTSKASSEVVNSIKGGIFKDIPVSLDYKEVEQVTVSLLYEELNRETKDAEYKKLDDGSVIVTDDVWGAKISKDDLKAVIDRINAGETVIINAKTTPPEKTKKDLEDLLFSSTLATYSTDFSTSSANRAHNVTLASNSINAKTLMPGEVFSYTEAIGNPSMANGYKLASVYENGKTTEGVGGGVCQVSSTLYSAVLYADIEVVERKNHSLTVSYVPKGQDATFAYELIDFKFKNNTEYPIKISSTVKGRTLTVSLLGTDTEPEKEVKINNVHVSTVAPGENITEDPSLPAGTRKVTSAGKNGYVYDTYKVIYKNGKQVSNEKITRSTYKATPAEVLVGTGEAVESPLPTDDITSDNQSDSNEEESPKTESSENISDSKETSKTDTNTTEENDLPAVEEDEKETITPQKKPSERPAGSIVEETDE